MKLSELQNRITTLPWNDSAGTFRALSTLPASRTYAAHAANVLPQLMEAVRRQCDDIYHPDLLEALRIAEDVKMENDEFRRTDPPLKP